MGTGISVRHKVQESPDVVNRRHRVSRRRRVFATAAALVAAVVLVSARLFVWPAEGMPAHVSAIVMLAWPG